MTYLNWLSITWNTKNGINDSILKYTIKIQIYIHTYIHIYIYRKKERKKERIHLRKYIMTKKGEKIETKVN